MACNLRSCTDPIKRKRHAPGLGLSQGLLTLDTDCCFDRGAEVPHTLGSVRNHKAMASNRRNTLMAEAGAGIVLPGPYEAGSRG